LSRRRFFVLDFGVFAVSALENVCGGDRRFLGKRVAEKFGRRDALDVIIEHILRRLSTPRAKRKGARGDFFPFGAFSTAFWERRVI